MNNMHRKIFLSLTLLWCGALAAMEGIQTAPATPALPSLDNIGYFAQWLQGDESVKDDGDRSFEGRIRYLQKLDKKRKEYGVALTVELKDITQVWLPRLRNPKMMGNSEIGLRDRVVMHKTITKKCEAIAKGLIRIDALTDLIDRRIEEYANRFYAHSPNFLHHHDVIDIRIPSMNDLGVYGLIRKLCDHPVLYNHVGRAFLYADPVLSGSWIYAKNENSIKEYIIKTFSYHVPLLPRMAHALDAMSMKQVRLLFRLATRMRKAICGVTTTDSSLHEDEEVDELERNREIFSNALELAPLEYVGRGGTPEGDSRFLFILSNLRLAAEDMNAIRFDVGLSRFILPNERLRNLRSLLDPWQQD